MNRQARQYTTRRRDPGKQPRQTGNGALGFAESAHPLAEAVRKLYATQPNDLKVELAVTRLALDLTLRD